MRTTIDILYTIVKLLKDFKFQQWYHQTTSLFLLKKRDIIRNYKDLRGISILPALMITFDKIIAPIVNKIGIGKINNKQFAVKPNSNTYMAKIDMYYAAKTKEIRQNAINRH